MLLEVESLRVQMFRESCLKLETNEFRCYEVKIEESEKSASLSRQCSATEPQ